jgi:hypothetical protein
VTTTALDVITDAFLMLGVYGPGDTIATIDQTTGLQVLNDMLDVWSNESLATFCILENNFPVVSGQQSYTIGPSAAQITATRPISILEDPGTVFVRDSNNIDYPMEVYPRDKWNVIGDKFVTGNIPEVLFYDPQFPLGVINLWPIPNLGGYTVYFDSYQQLGAFATVSTAFSFPPGYKRAMGTNLAVELKPYYADGQLDPVIVKSAADTKGSIKRSNRRDVFADTDPSLIANSSQFYNVYSDSYGR